MELSFFIDVILESKQVLPVVLHWNKHFTCLSVQQVVLFDSSEESNGALEPYMLISLLLKHSAFCPLCIQKCFFPLKGPKIHFCSRYIFQHDSRCGLEMAESSLSLRALSCWAL